MVQRKTITANSSEEIWQLINEDFIAGNSLHNYHITISQNGTSVDLDMVSSPGGNEEGGYEYTTLTSSIINTGFKFEIFPEDILNKVGKLFGMQDIKIGYTDFDKSVIIQSNDGGLLAQIFEDEQIRELFQNLSGYSLKTKQSDGNGEDHLELHLQRLVTDAGELHDIFNAFVHVLSFVNKSK